MKSGAIVTLFPRAKPFHMAKDVGMVPATLGQALQRPAYLVCAHSPEWDSCSAVEALEVIPLYLPHYRPLKPSWRVFAWLWSNSQRIELLHLFHFSLESVLYGLFFRWCRPKAKIYWKLDLDPVEFAKDYSHPARGLWARLDLWLRKRMIKSVDWISAETPVALDVFVQAFPSTQGKAFCLPNGVDADFIQGAAEQVPELGPCRILLAGRHGSQQKNSELIFPALESLDPQEWECVFLGEQTSGFAQNLQDWLEAHPSWQGKFQSLGQVNDRKEVGRQFAKAHIFVLPSRWESYGLVLGEALLAGAALVVADIPVARKFVDNPEMGRIFAQQDPVALAQALQELRGEAPHCRSLRKNRALGSDWPSVMQALVQRWEKRIP